MFFAKSVLAIVLMVPFAGPKTGTIKGHVSIGPLKPASRVGEVEVVPPRVYAEYKILLISADGKKEIGRYKLTDKGDYKITIAPGQYRIVWTGPVSPRVRLGTKNVEVKEGKSVTVDFDIDTGIR